jgi:hypothetical protein
VVGLGKGFELMPRTKEYCHHCMKFCPCVCRSRAMTCKICGESEISYFLDGVFFGTTKFQTIIKNKQEWCGLCR